MSLTRLKSPLSMPSKYFNTHFTSSKLPERLSDSSVGKESTCNAGDLKFDSWVRKLQWRRERLPTPVFLGFPGRSAGKEYACNAGDLGSIPGVGKIPWRRERLPNSSYSGVTRIA